MAVVLLQLGLWLLRKLLVGALIVALGLGFYGLFLYLQENVRIEVDRQALIERLDHELAVGRQTVLDLESELDRVQDRIDDARRSADAAERILEGLESLHSYWDWLFLSSAEREEVKRRKEQARIRRDKNRLVERISRERLDAITFEQASIQGVIAGLTARMAELEASPSEAVYYGNRAWERIRIPLLVALFFFFFGPTIWRVFSYYCIGRLIGLARPIVLSRDRQPMVNATTSHVSIELSLEPKEVLWIKEEFLQASDQALRKRTRFILNWQIPLTCLACGLFELIEIRNGSGGPHSITTSTQDRPTIEVAVVSIPSQAGVVIRPSFLVGVVSDGTQDLKIKRHWRIFSLQAWITLQFRYFEFRGPCRLVLAGSRGVRSEFLKCGADDELPGRRTNQDSTIGFTPDLHYRSTRAETFWSYYRGKNPLFDDLFQGSGSFFCQEISVKGRAAGVRAFWSHLWNALMKVFGI